ncbi:hypothetical protein HanPSC8_Chr16g0740761 [Helianthus annuus]|nr:hypothetical protein HanPSC8_Chr16g0740761 [Helianthus annuus]
MLLERVIIVFSRLNNNKDNILRFASFEISVSFTLPAGKVKPKFKVSSTGH